MENNLLLYHIDSRWLMWVYAIGLLLAGVVVADQFFLGKMLLPYLGMNSLLIPLYLLFFEMPHIIASFLGFVDTEYVQRYKFSLTVVLPMLLIGVVLLLYVHFLTAVVFYLCATVYHVIKQQTGIALILGAKRNIWHYVLVVLALLITTVLYTYLKLPELFSSIAFSSMNCLLFICVAIFLLVVAKVVRGTSNPKAKKYIVLTTLMLVASYIFILLGYNF
jgi:hypothetical protein